MMFGVIYKITNVVNYKIYIGQTTKTYKKRWTEHLWSAENGSTQWIHSAIRKYGKENFTVEQIDHAHNRNELDEKEQYWIEYYNSLAPNGYNLETGGVRNRCLSEIVRKRMSKTRTGENNHRFGKPLSDETKRKISEAHKGMTSPMKGKHLSEETKRKLSEAHKGKKMPELALKKLSERSKGEKNYFYGKHFCGSNHPNAIKVLCVETGEVFDCIRYAAKKYNLHHSDISKCCKNKAKTCGKLHWRYVTNG